MKNQKIAIETRKEVRDAYVRNVGPLDFKTRISESTGDVMTIASKDVVTIPPTMAVIDAVKTMLNKGFRRLPVADAGTNRLMGIVTSRDIVDFLGGGLRNLIIKNRFKGNFLKAINVGIGEIMEPDVVFLNEKDSLKSALNTMLNDNVGGIPITDDERGVKGIITERDFVFLVSDVVMGKTVGECMSKNIVTSPPDMPVGTAAKSMINNGFRRLPIIKDNVLIGIITASDILRFLGSGDVFNRLITGNAEEVFEVPVRTLIRRDVVFTSAGIDLGEAAGIMLDKNVGSLPVLEEGELKGIVTERDFVRVMAE